MTVSGTVLTVRMPAAEVFVVALDNEKSYVYDRETGILTKGDTNLETTARQVAEAEIRKAKLSGLIGEFTICTDEDTNVYYEAVIFESKEAYRSVAD